MAEALSRVANVPVVNTLTLNDISSFESVLDVNVNVVSSKLGNKFIRVMDNSDRTNLFIYLVESDNVEHFHGIASIAGFFGASYFCESCLKSYSKASHHSCETTCDTCGSKDCTTKELMSCRSCHRECRSNECFIRHKQILTTKNNTAPSRCATTYQCRICKKVMNYESRSPSEHVCGEWKCTTCQRFYVGQHWFYHRANTNESSSKKFIFYDFETRQDEIIQCEEGYDSSNTRCNICRNMHEPCNQCRTCVHCRQSWCGLNQHVVNLAVLQTSCSSCQDKELEPKSKCDICGNRCNICSKKDKRKQYITHRALDHVDSESTFLKATMQHHSFVLTFYVKNIRNQY